MPAQYPGIGFPPDSQVSLIRKLVNNTALTAENPGGGGVSWVTAPASAAASGVAGQLAYDAQYLYVAVATNTWRRTAISEW